MDSRVRKILFSVRIAVLLIGTAVLALSFPPITGVFNEGAVFGMLIAAVFLVYAIFAPAVHRFVKYLGRWRVGKAALCAVAFVLACGAVFLAVACTAIALSAADRPDGDVAVVIVLGCRVNGEEPGKMLTLRLERAKEFLSEHQDAVCILSGGQGPDEGISEAEAMRRYLTAYGIDGSRLIIEDRSTNTEENLRYSAAIIEEMELPREVAVVTNGFHQCRADRLAERVGLTASAVNADTEFLHFLPYFLREVLGFAYYTVN